MKITMVGGGIALLIAGAVWLLQGLNILPGSFMTGQTFWAWAGIVALLAGSVLLFRGLRSGKKG
jgi:hypothetical protein